jgi:phosphoribosylformylglycinamidine synthase
MLRNQSLQFICKYIHLRTESTGTPFTGRVSGGKVLRLPIAHGEGNYYCDDATLKRLQQEKRIVFRYCDASGAVTPEANPNGSRDNIAGICSERGNVLGMMPHPERAMEACMGSTDGRELFFSLLATALVRRH